MAKLIDTHCHLTHGRLQQDTAGVMARAAGAGVIAIICAAADLRESAAAAALAGKMDNVYCLAGLHPHDAQKAPEDYIQKLQLLSADAKNVAIGEIGLDYHYDFSPRENQRQIFAQQLELAGQLDKNVVIHTREAFQDTMAILAESGFDGTRVVFHSFTDGPQNTQKILDIGAMVSFSGIVTFKNSDALRESAAIVPDDRLLIETDAPFLSPEPVRKMKTNEPANVAHVATAVAAVRNSTIEKIAELTTANAIRFFGLAVENDYNNVANE